MSGDRMSANSKLGVSRRELLAFGAYGLTGAALSSLVTGSADAKAPQCGVKQLIVKFVTLALRRLQPSSKFPFPFNTFQVGDHD